MRSSAARSSGSSASTSARRIDSRAVAISLASAHPESVSVTFTVRRSAVPRARVTCPSASSWSTSRTTREWLSPRLQASRSIGLPDAKAASAATAAARPPGPEADAVVAASTSRASASTTAPSTFAVCCAAGSMPGAYMSNAGSVPRTWSAPSATPAVAADAAAVTEVVMALESSLYGQTSFSQADLEDEWSDLDLEQNARVVRDGDRIVGYGAVHELGELWRAEGYVHPDAFGRGIGRLIATGLEERRGPPRRAQDPEQRLRGRLRRPRAARVARLRRRARLPRDAHRARGAAARTRVAGRAARRRASTRSVTRSSSTPRTRRRSRITGTTRRATSSRGRRATSASERFDPTLWCVVRAGDEIAAGTICTGDTYGGGWVHALFTRRPWRRQGVGAALLATRSGASGSAASTASGSASTRRTTPARSASTSAPGWRPCSAG